MSTMARRVTIDLPATGRSGMRWHNLQPERRKRCAIIPPRSVPVGSRFRLSRIREDLMARSCAVCGKVSMDGFNPQSSGMNRVRAHRRFSRTFSRRPSRSTASREDPRLHPLPAHSLARGPLAPPAGGRSNELIGVDPRSAPISFRCTRTTVPSGRGRGSMPSSSLSSQIVNGPSLTSSTSISAPKRPCGPARRSTPGSRRRPRTAARRRPGPRRR
jgi:hypothetical protein